MAPITKLNSYINQVIPYAWDDSESWFEFLAKIQAKVNELVVANNDFFSVDVREYIIDKIDSWKIDGTLAAIIQPMINELTGIPYNVMMFGAVADGVENDTLSIQAAIDYAHSKGGGVVSLPIPPLDGFYNVTGTLILKKNVELRGASSYSNLDISHQTRIRHNPTVPGSDLFILDSPPSTLGYLPGVKIANLTVSGNANSNIAFKLHYPTNLTMSNVYILGGFEDGIEIKQGMNCRFEMVNIIHIRQTCLVIKKESTTLTFDSCYFHESNTPVRIESGNLGISFVNQCIFESCMNGLDIHVNNQVVFESPYVEHIPRSNPGVAIFKLGINGADEPSYSKGTCVIIGGDIKGINAALDESSLAFQLDRWASLVVIGGRVMNFYKTIEKTNNTKTVSFVGLFEQQIAIKLLDVAGINVLGSNYLGENTTNKYFHVPPLPQYDTTKYAMLFGPVTPDIGNIGNNVALTCENVHGVAALKIRKGDGRTGMIQTVQFGSTAERPTTGLVMGMMYFDYSLNKPIWVNTTLNGWIDATGETV